MGLPFPQVIRKESLHQTGQKSACSEVEAATRSPPSTRAPPLQWEQTAKCDMSQPLGGLDFLQEALRSGTDRQGTRSGGLAGVALLLVFVADDRAAHEIDDVFG